MKNDDQWRREVDQLAITSITCIGGLIVGLLLLLSLI